MPAWHKRGNRTAHRASRSRRESATEEAAVDVDVFFAGVAEMRTYLDRHIQDPERRRARLARIAADLLKPRAAGEFGEWLATQLCEALGASACSILLRRTGWTLWRGVGSSDRQPPAERLEALSDLAVSVQPEDGGLLAPIPGLDELLGVLWLEGAQALDERSGVLLAALAQTAGAVLEQSLRVAAVTHDPLTGLLSEAVFTEQARIRLAAVGAGGDSAVVAAFRIAGIDAIAEAYGLSTAQAAIRHLATAAEHTLPRGTLLGVRFDDVLALLAPVEEAIAQTQLGRLCREIDAAVRRHAGGSSATPAVSCAFVVASAPPPDLADLVAAVGRGVADAPTGAAIPAL